MATKRNRVTDALGAARGAQRMGRRATPGRTADSGGASAPQAPEKFNGPLGPGQGWGTGPQPNTQFQPNTNQNKVGVQELPMPPEGRMSPGATNPIGVDPGIDEILRQFNGGSGNPNIPELPFTKPMGVDPIPMIGDLENRQPPPVGLDPVPGPGVLDNLNDGMGFDEMRSYLSGGNFPVGGEIPYGDDMRATEIPGPQAKPKAPISPVAGAIMAPFGDQMKGRRIRNRQPPFAMK